MKVLASLALAAACVITSPAFAGPQGAGLTFTEEVARKALLKKKAEAAAKVQTSSDCAAPQAGEPGKSDKDAKSKTCRAS